MNNDYLVIIFPLFFSLVLSYFIPMTLRGNGNVISILKIDREPLYEQGLFWIAVLTPIFLGATLILENSYKYKFSLGTKEYDFFLKTNTFPLIILGTILPGTALVSSLHRTKQVAEQIRESERKNFSDSHYSHFRFYIDYFKSLKQDKTAEKISASYCIDPITYSLLFPDSNPENGVGVYSRPYLSDIQNSLQRARKHLSIIYAEDNREEIIKHYVASIDYINDAAELMTMDKEISSKYDETIQGSFFDDGRIRHLYRLRDVENLIATYIFIRQNYFNLAKFCKIKKIPYEYPTDDIMESRIDVIGYEFDRYQNHKITIALDAIKRTPNPITTFKN